MIAKPFSMAVVGQKPNSPTVALFYYVLLAVSMAEAQGKACNIARNDGYQVICYGGQELSAGIKLGYNGVEYLLMTSLEVIPKET